MASLLFTIDGAAVNALAFSGTNFSFSRLADHGKQERKRHDLAHENVQRARDQWNEDRMKRLDFINKRLREQDKARAYIMKQCLNTIEYLQKNQSLYRLSLNYWVFIIHQRHKKMMNYYLLQWVQVLEHMLYTSTLNK